jgi:CHAT domain-containing protein/tetratricopeptide (TPR) repeat protein
MRTDELLAPPPAAADPLKELLDAVRGVQGALRPGPTPAAELAKTAASAYGRGDYGGALESVKQALHASVERFGPDNPEAGVLLGMIGRVCTGLGRTERAEGVLEEALRRVGAERAKAKAGILDAMGQLYRQRGEYEAAAAAFERARNEAHDNADEARVLNQLALVRDEMAEQSEALSLYQRGLSASGPDDPERATILANFGGFQRRRGELKQADASLSEALEIETHAGRAQGPGAAIIHNQLGLIDQDLGDYDNSEHEFDEAQRIAEKLPRPSQLILIAIRNNLALLNRDRGDGKAALSLLEKAAGELTSQSNTPHAATILQNLADTYAVQGRTNCAGPLYERAASIWERHFKSDHPDALRVQVSRAWLDRERGDFESAERRLQSTLDRLEKRLGSDSPEVARTRNDLAEVLRLQGKVEASAALYASALLGLERSLGKGHPDTATVLFNQAMLEWQRGAITLAIALAGEATELRERHARVILAHGSEQQKLLFARTLSGETAAVISLQADAPDDPSSRKLAVETLVGRKGRVLEEAASLVASTSGEEHAEARALLDKWRTKRSELAALFLNPTRPEGGSDAAARQGILEEQILSLEQQLSRLNKAVPAGAKQINLVSLRSKIPDSTALTEFVHYTLAPLAREAGLARYAAFVMRKQGDPSFVDLGEAVPIDDIIKELRQMLHDRRSDAANRVASQLHNKLILPLSLHIRGVTRVLIAPDGELNLLPFAMLRDAEDRYLVERYELSFLTSGRDLTRVASIGSPLETPVVIGDPDYGFSDGTASSMICFPPLQGSEKETEDIAELLHVTPLLRDKATKKALMEVHAPQILHLSTHGFFSSMGDDSACFGPQNGQFAGNRETIISGLLHSGIALAQANRRRDYGVLTGLEAAGLDLHGTQLVVLSACETGLGTTESGEGVLGFRYALAMAGAEAQLTSLWTIDNAAAQALIKDYYRNLLDGAGRAEALSEAQRAMLKDHRWTEPRYWAAFIPVGAWTPLAGTRKDQLQ